MATCINSIKRARNIITDGSTMGLILEEDPELPHFVSNVPISVPTSSTAEGSDMWNVCVRVCFLYVCEETSIPTASMNIFPSVVSGESSHVPPGQLTFDFFLVFVLRTSQWSAVKWITSRVCVSVCAVVQQAILSFGLWIAGDPEHCQLRCLCFTVSCPFTYSADRHQQLERRFPFLSVCLVGVKPIT